jgi:hypothetical protein
MKLLIEIQLSDDGGETGLSTFAHIRETISHLPHGSKTIQPGEGGSLRYFGVGEQVGSWRVAEDSDEYDAPTVLVGGSTATHRGTNAYEGELMVITCSCGQTFKNWMPTQALSDFDDHLPAPEIPRGPGRHRNTVHDIHERAHQFALHTIKED